MRVSEALATALRLMSWVRRIESMVAVSCLRSVGQWSAAWLYCVDVDVNVAENGRLDSRCVLGDTRSLPCVAEVFPLSSTGS